MKPQKPQTARLRPPIQRLPLRPIQHRLRPLKRESPHRARVLHLPPLKHPPVRLQTGTITAPTSTLTMVAHQARTATTVVAQLTPSSGTTSGICGRKTVTVVEPPTPITTTVVTYPEWVRPCVEVATLSLIREPFIRGSRLLAVLSLILTVPPARKPACRTVKL